MRSRREGVMSATMQIKVLTSEIILVAPGQGFHLLEAGIKRTPQLSAQLTCRALRLWQASKRSILQLARTETYRTEAVKNLKE